MQIREVIYGLKSFLLRIIYLSAKNKVRVLLAHVKLFIIRRNRLKHIVLNILANFPKLAKYLKQVMVEPYPAVRDSLVPILETESGLQNIPGQSDLKYMSKNDIETALVHACAPWRLGKRINASQR
jgi:hypothetical protein